MKTSFKTLVLTASLRDFIQKHINDDTSSLLLAAKRYPDIDVPFAVDQIEARKRLRMKLPDWFANAELIMGGRVPAEQCSSELTAQYKREIIDGESLCDMTGGMGVDFWYMSRGMRSAIYTERQVHLCEAARHNFAALADGQHPDAEVRVGDGRDLPIPTVDVIYLDPARRAMDGSRVYAIEDCEPNIIEWQDNLLAHANMVLTKVSPMIDITDALRKLRNVTEVHIVAVKNECKEVLFKQVAGKQEDERTVTFHCVDFLSSGKMHYSFTPSTHSTLSTLSTPSTLSTHSTLSPPSTNFLYEPDVTLMKAQAFAEICRDYPVCPLDIDTHLFVSSQFIPDFPGRAFVVDEQIPFSSKTLKRLKKDIPKANIAVRNFILTADQLRQRTGIKDGGEVYLFGAKVSGVGEMLFKCRKSYKL